MSNLGKERPEGWEGSSLGQFFETLFSNTVASYHNLKVERSKLEAVDNIFDTLLKDFIDPEHFLPALLTLRSIGAYRVASLLSMTAPIDAYASMRSCLEYAGYAHFIMTKPESGEVWLNREDNEASRKKVCDTFTAKAVLKAIKAADEKLGGTYGYLYDWTISHGAHPNERALTNSLEIVEDPGQRQTHMRVVLLPEGGPPMKDAMKTCAQVGIAALKISALVFPKRFEELGLNDAIKAASRGL
jgi:hypothetical protein